MSVLTTPTPLVISPKKNSLNCADKWIWQNEVYTLRIPRSIKSAEKNILIISFSENNLIEQEDPGTGPVNGPILGTLRVPFFSLLHLGDGTFTLPFTPVTSTLGVIIRGTLTFKIRLKYPYWDSISPNIPSVFRRRIRIISATNLPNVNHQRPNASCGLYLKGSDVIEVRTYGTIRFRILFRLSH